jgi:hypothetical protein
MEAQINVSKEKALRGFNPEKSRKNVVAVQVHVQVFAFLSFVS